MDDATNLPVVAGNKPIGIKLEEGRKYWFCACGRSKNQPFCDGSHKGTGITPLAFDAERPGKSFLCACKHTASPPYCDGSHKQFSEEDVGSEAG